MTILSGTTVYASLFLTILIFKSSAHAFSAGPSDFRFLTDQQIRRLGPARKLRAC